MNKIYNDTEQKQEVLRIIDNVYSIGYDKGYQDGLDDGKINDAQTIIDTAINNLWECVRKIALPNEEGGYTIEQLKEIFDTKSISSIIKNNTASEIVHKMVEYEKEQEQIHFGDEVLVDERKFVALGVDKSGWIHLMSLDNCLTHSNVPAIAMKKTGKHYDLDNVFELNNFCDLDDVDDIDEL